MQPNYEELDRKFPSQSHKLEKFRQEFQQVQHLDGDFAEFGVYNGNGSRDLSRLDAGRKVWAFDTFCGMPTEGYHPNEDSSDPPGKWKPYGSPLEMFEGIPNIVPVMGEFRFTLPAMPPSLRLVMVHIDCDWYESHRMVLEFLEKHLVPGGVVLLDDAHLTGAKRAIAEWVEKVNKPRVLRPLDDKLIWNG